MQTILENQTNPNTSIGLGRVAMYSLLADWVYLLLRTEDPPTPLERASRQQVASAQGHGQVPRRAAEHFGMTVQKAPGVRKIPGSPAFP